MSGMPHVRLPQKATRIALGLSAALALALSFGAGMVNGALLRPVVFTGEASQLTTSSATLNGSVDPSNQPTSYFFEYGATASYGSQTPTGMAAAGNQSLHVTASLAALAVATTYHYRLVAVNASGTTVGADRSFTTKRVPLVLTLVPPGRRLFGDPFTVTGVVSGTGSAGAMLALEANPFPYLAGFSVLGTPIAAEQNGSFSLHAPGLGENSQLRVSTVGVPRVSSRVAVALVAVRVRLHVRHAARRGYAQFYGTVTPAETGALIGLQLVRRGHRPLGVGLTLATGGRSKESRFSKIVHIPRGGLYRAYVYVVSGAQVSNHSPAIQVGRP
jgi:hypothetical protein